MISALFFTLALASADYAFVGCQIRTVCCADVPGGTVVVSDGRIEAVGMNVAIPSQAEIIRCAPGDVLTPGLIEADTSIGLTEILLEPMSNDAQPTLPDPVRARLDPRDALDPRSSLVGVARHHGITSVVTGPSGGVVEGQMVWMDLLDGRGVANAYTEPVAMSAHAGQAGAMAYGQSRLGAFSVLRAFFEDAAWFRRNKTSFLRNDMYGTGVHRADLEAAQPVVMGKMPLMVEVHRAADISRTIAWADEEGIELIIVGAAEGHLVATELAAADVPVIVDATLNLPVQFEARQVVTDGPAQMEGAGVRVLFATRSAHNAGNLRFHVGNAVRAGFPAERALEAATVRVARAFGRDDIGVVEEGARADLVVWSGDPFEPTSWAKSVMIEGEPQSVENRQTRLAERYVERLGLRP